MSFVNGMTSQTSPASTSRAKLRIGFVPLIDAAPILVAKELGFFAEDGLEVELERQLGWGNVRDKLTFGRLDAAHALLGMPLFSQLGRDWFAEPLVSVMNLGSGGNAITISKRLADAGVTSGTSLAEYMQRDTRAEALIFAHVFSCSMHHYLLREWLSSAGIDPDLDVRLRIFPPSQMSSNMEKGHIQGFCVGEPWNTLAERNGAGKIVAVTTDVMPNHPEKSLVVSKKWASENGAILPSLIRAVLRACSFCDNPANNSRLTEILARPGYIDAPADVIHASVRLELDFDHRTQAPDRSNQRRLRSFGPNTTFPSATPSVWMLRQMSKWNQLTTEVDELAIAPRCVESAAYRTAAESLGIACPVNDFPVMPLRGGVFDPTIPAITQPATTELEGVLK